MNEKLNVCINDKVSIYSLLQSDQLDTNQQSMDIGEKMKQRALNSYGVQEDFLSNLELVSNDKQESDLRYLWHWFDCKFNRFSSNVPGVLLSQANYGMVTPLERFYHGHYLVANHIS